MAEKLNITKEVVNSDWRDDVDVDYAIYGGNDKKESEYVSPEIGMEEEQKIEKIKSRNIKIGLSAILTNRDKFAA